MDIKNKLAKVSGKWKAIYRNHCSKPLPALLFLDADNSFLATVIITINFCFASEYMENEEEQQYIEELLSYQIEGLIVLSHTLPSEKLASYQIPVIAIEREAEYISSVNTDNYMGHTSKLLPC